MTRSIVSHAQRQRTSGNGSRISEQLSHVTHAGSNPPGATAPLRIVVKQMRILLHHRAASGSVDRDELGAGFLECRDVPPRELTRTLEITSMRVKRTAARLTARFHHRVPVALENSLSRAVGIGEQPFHDAPFEKSR